MLQSNAQCYMTRRMLYCFILTPLSSQCTITKCQISTYTLPMYYHKVPDFNIHSNILHTFQHARHMFNASPYEGKGNSGKRVRNFLFQFMKISWFWSTDLLFGPPLQKDLMWQDQDFTETRSLVLNAQSPYQENACHRMHKQEVQNVEPLIFHEM